MSWVCVRVTMEWLLGGRSSRARQFVQLSMGLNLVTSLYLDGHWFSQRSDCSLYTLGIGLPSGCERLTLYWVSLTSEHVSLDLTPIEFLLTL